METLIYISIFLSILTLILLGFIYSFFLKQKSKEVDQSNDSLEKDIKEISLSIKNHSEHLAKISEDMISFKEPMTSLNRYLSGTALSGKFGEWGLEAIIKESLSSSQYEKDFMINPESSERVEFAIKMPDGLYLPVDSKFHSRAIDNFHALEEYSEGGGQEKKVLFDKARKKIIDDMKSDARDIKEKYMAEGLTVDLGIMFLPSENLNHLIDTPEFKRRNNGRSIREEIYNDYKILIMGPNTFAAYLISVHMGFKTLSINEKSKKIISTLGKIRNEFSKFNESTKLLIKQTEALVSRAQEQQTRERAMGRLLDNIEEID